MTSYDPGTVQGMTQIDASVWHVDSFRGEVAAYVVNTATGVCSCPHFTKRLAGTGQACKHMVAVAQAETFNRLMEKAKAATTEALESLLPIYEQRGRLDIALAIRAEMFDRQGS